MRAGDLASPHESLAAEAAAAEAAAVLGRRDVRAILVLESGGGLAGVLSDSFLLRRLLPSYVAEDEALAGVLDESFAGELAARLDGLRVEDLLPPDSDETPEVDQEATLVQVASVMVRTRSPLVGVLEDGRLVGGIAINDLLAQLMRRP